MRLGGALTPRDEQAFGPSLFRVGDWKVDATLNRVSRGQREVRIEPKAMAVLVYLAGRPGRAVTRAELESHVWAGTVVTYDALTGAIQKLRRVFDDDPTAPRFIETVSKKGYRLIAPVSALEASAGHEDPEVHSTGLFPRGLQIRFGSAAGVVGMLAVTLVGSIWYYLGSPREEEPALASTPKTLAVLPFENLTGDPAQAYFAEGMSDDLITSLARFSDLHVIARDSSFFYRDLALGSRELADRLNARYLLRGSVRRTAQRLRINAQLIDAHSEHIVWADSFDDDPEGMFELQDGITRKIVAALAGQMNVHDRQELGHPRTKNLRAYDYFLFGRQRFFQYGSAEDNQRARDSFQRALALDPDFAMAYAMLAWTHAFDAMNGWSPSREDSLSQAIELATRAVVLDEAMPVAYFVRGLAYRELGDRVSALVEAEKAIAFDPNYAGAHVLLATLMYFNGRAQEGLTLMNKAIALNPNHPFNYSFHLGQAYYILKRYNEAIGALERVLQSNPAAERVHLWLAAAYAQAGRGEDAAWEVEQLLVENPDFTLRSVKDAYPFADSADLAHFLKGLRKAGLSD